jgi:hypothetical protein
MVTPQTQHGGAGGDSVALLYRDFSSIPNFIDASIYTVRFTSSDGQRTLYANQTSIEIITSKSWLNFSTPSLPEGDVGMTVSGNV